MRVRQKEFRNVKKHQKSSRILESRFKVVGALEKGLETVWKDTPIVQMKTLEKLKRGEYYSLIYIKKIIIIDHNVWNILSIYFSNQIYVNPLQQVMLAKYMLFLSPTVKCIEKRQKREKKEQIFNCAYFTPVQN